MRSRPKYTMQATLDTLQEAIEEGQEAETREITQELLDQGIDPKEAIKAASDVLGEIGEKYDRGEYFLFDLVASGDAMNAAREILEAEIVERGGTRDNARPVVLGTVEGDIHNIGKKILGALLSANGFDVIDLGVEVPADEFVESVKGQDAVAVGASALLTTTKEKQRELVERLEKAGLKDEVVVMVGGAPCSKEWKAEIGADLYSENAFEAVEDLEQHLGASIKQ